MTEAFAAYHDAFYEVIGDVPQLIEVVRVDAHEGPVYVADEDALYFTTLPKETNMPLPGYRTAIIKRLQLNGSAFPMNADNISIVCDSANMANGMTLDRDGHLIVCEQGTRSEHACISQINLKTKKSETVIDHWRGLRLNSPNDVVVRSDGSIWFTDPCYGFLQGFKCEPQLGDYVYRYNPQSRALSVVEDSFNKPNGLCFSPDESVLYVTDSGANQEQESFYAHLPHHIRAFDVQHARHLSNGRLFAVTNPGFPDGLKTDSQGRVYASAFNGVQVFSPEGDLIGEILLPGAVNFTFGGQDKNLLFITRDDAVWVAVLKARGV